MLLALIRLIRTRWASVVVYLSELWGGLLSFTSATAIRALKPNTKVHEPEPEPEPEPETEATGPAATAFLLDHQGFPLTTPEQDNKVIKAFIESLDTDAVCALASRYNFGRPCRVAKRDNGSFNVCFFVEFDDDGPKWIVRVPIEPSLHKPWQKLLSEVATVQYLERNTRIPVPHIRAYGRDAKLTKTGTGAQMFLISHLIPGKPLAKKDLFEAPEENRRKFYSQLIDILAELRKLEFPSIGSLMPNPDGSLNPVLGPVMSMTANSFRQPLPIFTSAKDYMARQFKIVEDQYRPPVEDLSPGDFEHEVFALHRLENYFCQVIDTNLENGPFVLHHLDLRSPNTIVDENLQIQGIIDWEFSGTVPLQLFTPPSWITAHDSAWTKEEMHAEFRGVLDDKSKTDSRCHLLRKEWYGQSDNDRSVIAKTDMAFCIAHVLRRPEDAHLIFYAFFAPKLYNVPIKDVKAEFFKENAVFAEEAQRRADRSQKYTQYLKDHGLYVVNEKKLWLAKSKAFREKLEARDLKKKLERANAQD
ncbi:hypothetical protein TOPH_06888 [Tolypocladium ophioglossoides CBS 100239]|uniref:Aminoglycoside phosphotransferase domain-containing protein n=1 Tax=Tolypocladium ophioglossoides (strain CBS 100239) TaxID=1163406 RepID=A0A0L0N370_TOLOC|nr:hypothetical protein TOPH_06888 [Tolypocladium ophioglossoides CBS 100239]